jgi:hypothetical protein
MNSLVYYADSAKTVAKGVIRLSGAKYAYDCAKWLPVDVRAFHVFLLLLTEFGLGTEK